MRSTANLLLFAIFFQRFSFEMILCFSIPKQSLFTPSPNGKEGMLSARRFHSLSSSSNTLQDLNYRKIKTGSLLLYGIKSDTGNENSNLHEKVKSMRIKEIQNELRIRGIFYGGIFEKEELVKLMVNSYEVDGIEFSKEKSNKQMEFLANNVPCITVPIDIIRPPPSIYSNQGVFKSDQGPKSYIKVEVHIGQHRAKLLLDSGAGRTIFSESLAKRIIDASPTTINRKINVAGVGAGGMSSADQMFVENFTLGGQGYTKVNFDVIVLKETKNVLPSGVEGILGFDYFRRIGAFLEIDFTEKSVKLVPRINIVDVDKELQEKVRRELLIKKTYSEAINFQISNLSGLPICEVYLESSSSSIPGIIDLGAGMSLINYVGIKSLNVNQGRIKRGDLSVLGIDGRPREVERITMREIHLKSGGNRILVATSRDIAISDLPAMEMIGFKNKPCIVVGMDVLQSKGIFFDMIQSNMYLY